MDIERPGPRMDFVRCWIPMTALLVGCSSDPPSTTTPPEPTLESLQAKVFDPRCSAAGCHHIDLAKSDLSLGNQELTLRSMVNVPPSDPALRGRYPARIVPGDPDRSFLMRKLIGPTSGEGVRMPMNGAPLDAPTIEAIRTWIARMPK